MGRVYLEGGRHLVEGLGFRVGFRVYDALGGGIGRDRVYA